MKVVRGKHPEPAPPLRAQREEFFVGDTVGFTDKLLSERVGTIELPTKLFNTSNSTDHPSLRSLVAVGEK